MKINKQAPQIAQGGVSPIQQTQPLPSVSQTGVQDGAAQFEQGGSLASQLVPTPDMNQSAPSKGPSLLSLQIGQIGQTDQPGQVGQAGQNIQNAQNGQIGQVGQVEEPGGGLTLADFQSAAKAMMSQVEEIQGRITEELRTEDAITGITVGKSDGGYHINVVMGNNPTFTPPQVKAAGENLLQELGFDGMNVKVIAPAVNPFPPSPAELPSVPVDLFAGISAAADKFLFSGSPANLEEKPNVEGLEHYLLRDKMPVDGSREEVFVDRANGTFYMSSTILSRMGPEFSGTSWSGPHKLD